MMDWIQLEPEHELLLRCASPKLDSRAEERIKALLQGPLNEATVVRHANHHGIVGLVEFHLRRLVSDHVLLDALTPPAQAITVRNLQHMRELVRVVGALHETGVPVLPFKGPLLGHRAYGNAAFRTYQDLDVLVPRSDLHAAKKELMRQGYRPLYDLTAEEERQRIEAQVGYELIREKQGITHVVELHWSFLNVVHNFSLDPGAVFERAEWVTLGGQKVQTMRPEDLLLYLTAHGAKHHWVRIKWIADVNAVIQTRQDLNWPLLLERAETLGSLRMLGLGLYLASELLELALPPSVQAQVYSDRVIPRLARKIVGSWLFRDPDHPRVAGFEAFWFLVCTRERWSDNLPLVKHSARLLVNPSRQDEAFVSLPDSLHGLYYLVRPFRVLKQRLF